MKNEAGKLDIVELNSNNLKDVNRVDSSFEVMSRIIPKLEHGEFSFTFEEVSPVFTKSYPPEELDYASYINNPDKVIYLTYIENDIAGQVVLRKNWNKFAYIEDISVSSKFRRNKVGTRLTRASIKWAKKRQMPGIMLETQDNNVPAVKFYESCGFKLGGFDGYLYKGCGNPYEKEKALFMYLLF